MLLASAHPFSHLLPKHGPACVSHTGHGACACVGAARPGSSSPCSGCPLRKHLRSPPSEAPGRPTTPPWHASEGLVLQVPALTLLHWGGCFCACSPRLLTGRDPILSELCPKCPAGDLAARRGRTHLQAATGGQYVPSVWDLLREGALVLCVHMCASMCTCVDAWCVCTFVRVCVCVCMHRAWGRVFV